MERLIIVSNRLPLTARIEDGDVQLERSGGGLATGLWPIHEQSGGMWIGWPGELPKLSRSQRLNLDSELARQRIAPVMLSRREVREYYEAISNGVLWPVFQYLIEGIPLRAVGWETYRSVNEKFAHAVAAQYQPGDQIWVHDFQLLLVPGMLRRLLPDARIGFFLHIPFPSEEVFSVLPWRQEILEGMLGADLIGFHTSSFLRHFSNSARRLLGAEPDVDRLTIGDRSVALGVFPMGIDAATWDHRARSEAVRDAADSIRTESGGRPLLLGIDRLDYTKGIPRRLLAFDDVLADESETAIQSRLIQVTVPSRERVDAYAAFRRSVDQLVGEINGKHSSASAVPIHRLHQSLSSDELSALYGAADVMLVTSLRDGMNLVAKEFIASRPDGDGVLILSEFAGAAEELTEALIVNPYDVAGMANAIRMALAMPNDERRRRMAALRAAVLEHDVHAWVSTFLDRLSTTHPVVKEPACSMRALSPVIETLRARGHFLVVLDYDGTLVQLVDDPADAAPDHDLIEILRALTERPGTSAHIVTGRDHHTIDRWLGHLDLGLHAEHGLWTRPTRMTAWRELVQTAPAWKERVRPVLEHFVDTTAGSLIEEKSASLVWHYRKVGGGDDSIGENRARELRTTLAELLSNAPLDVRSSKKTVEIVPRGVSKGTIMTSLLADAEPGTSVLVIGDDETDEDIFAAAPPRAVTIRVGDGDTRAAYRLVGPHDVRMLLRRILASSAINARAANGVT